MSAHELFQWTYSPIDYFEEPFIEVRDDYTMTISPGKVEARVASNTFAENPAIGDEMHTFLNDCFLGAMLIEFRRYELSESRRTRIHPTGQKDIFVGVQGVNALLAVGKGGLRVTSAEGVVYDSKAQRAAEQKKLRALVHSHRSSCPVLTDMLTSFRNAIHDPQNELVYLYEVRDALVKKFGEMSKAITALGLTTAAWSRLGKLCNDETLRQGRHRGKNGVPLRDATQAELQEAREIARSMIKLFFDHLKNKT